MRRALIILSVLTVLLGSSSALADKRDLTPMPKVAAGSVPITGEYWALIIGINRYKEAPPLESAVKDATGVRDVLVQRYGFKRERIIELLDAQATRTNIESALFRLGQQAKAEDSVLIYYAGHGQYDEEGRLGWWVPVEAQPKNPGTFITNASIRDYIEGMKAKHVYLVADSCFSGTLFGKARGMPPLNEQFFTRLYAKKSRWGLTSGGTEPVADAGKGGHSIFAYHFIGLLKENTDPYLVPSHIIDQIAPVIANNSDQTPRSEPLKGAGDEGGQFVFRLASGMATKKEASPSASASGSSEEMAQMREELEALKKQMTAPKAETPKPTEEARVRPYEAPRKGQIQDWIGTWSFPAHIASQAKSWKPFGSGWRPFDPETKTLRLTVKTITETGEVTAEFSDSYLGMWAGTATQNSLSLHQVSEPNISELTKIRRYQVTEHNGRLEVSRSDERFTINFSYVFEIKQTDFFDPTTLRYNYSYNGPLNR